MNKHLLAFAVLASGAALSWVLHTSRTGASDAAARARRTRATQTELLFQTRSERIALDERVREMKHELFLKEQIATGSDASLLTATATNLSPAQSEKLVAELGFNWNSTRDYVVVSKDSLKTVSFSAMKEMKLTDAACSVLAITPEERNAIDVTTEQLGEEYNSWAKAHVHREDPQGDVVAKYSIATDPTFSAGLSNRFTAAVRAAVGSERGDLLRGFSYSWMSELGMFGGHDTTLTLRRYLAGENRGLNMEIRQDQSTMSTEVTPYQPLPAAFQPIFPGGWTELAQREGFDLPKEFSKSR